jgi:hypothetical protein
MFSNLVLVELLSEKFLVFVFIFDLIPHSEQLLFLGNLFILPFTNFIIYIYPVFSLKCWAAFPLSSILQKLDIDFAIHTFFGKTV